MDEEDIRAEERAYARALPILMAGGLALLFGAGIALGGWWLPGLGIGLIGIALGCIGITISAPRQPITRRDDPPS
jgi:hypothetical protein